MFIFKAHFSVPAIQLLSHGTFLFFYDLIIGYEKLVQKLIDKGANLNAVDYENDTALHYAVDNGNSFFKHFILFK